jgi:hypothetical protein
VSTIEVPPLFLLLPAILIGGYLGFRRGWLAEIGTSAGLALTISLLWNGPDLLVGAFNWLLMLLTRVVLAVVGGEPRQPPPVVSVNPTLEPVVTLGLLVLLVVLAYLVGSRLGQHFGGRDRAGRLFGGLVGALNLFVLMSRMTGYLAQVGPTPPGLGGVAIRIPSFPGLNIVIPPPPESALVTGWPLAAVVILLIATLVFALMRMTRA